MYLQGVRPADQRIGKPLMSSVLYSQHQISEMAFASDAKHAGGETSAPQPKVRDHLSIGVDISFLTREETRDSTVVDTENTLQE